MLQSPQGVQYKRNLQHIKPFNMPDQKERETSLQDAEPWNVKPKVRSNNGPSQGSERLCFILRLVAFAVILISVAVLRWIAPVFRFLTVRTLDENSQKSNQDHNKIFV